MRRSGGTKVCVRLLLQIAEADLIQGSCLGRLQIIISSVKHKRELF